MVPVQLLIDGKMTEVKLAPKEFSSTCYPEIALTPYAKTLERKRYIQIITVTEETKVVQPPTPVKAKPKPKAKPKKKVEEAEDKVIATDEPELDAKTEKPVSTPKKRKPRAAAKKRNGNSKKR